MDVMDCEVMVMVKSSLAASSSHHPHHPSRLGGACVAVLVCSAGPRPPLVPWCVGVGAPVLWQHPRGPGREEG